MNISLSEIDRQRFGVVTAKARLAGPHAVPDVLAWCARHQVQLLVARCATTELALVRQLEQAGAFLTDTLVYFSKHPIDARAPAMPDGYSTRLARAADAQDVGRLAARSFADYFGHYHVDPRLLRAACDQVYVEWAAHSCSRNDVADAVIVIEHGPEIVAFATIKRHSPQDCEGVLFGVHPAHQGKGLYHALMQLAQHWASTQGLVRMQVSTQITNLAVQKAWCRQGFAPSSSLYTLHHWFEVAP